MVGIRRLPVDLLVAGQPAEILALGLVVDRIAEVVVVPVLLAGLCLGVLPCGLLPVALLLERLLLVGLLFLRLPVACGRLFGACVLNGLFLRSGGFALTVLELARLAAEVLEMVLAGLVLGSGFGGGDGLRLDGCGGSFGGVFLTLLEGTVLAEAALREGLARLAGLSLLGGGALGGSGLRLHNGIGFGGCGLDGEGFVPVGLGGLARLLAEGLALLILSEVLAVLSETILPVLALAVLRLAALPAAAAFAAVVLLAPVALGGLGRAAVFRADRELFAAQKLADNGAGLGKVVRIFKRQALFGGDEELFKERKRFGRDDRHELARAVGRQGQMLEIGFGTT